MGCVAMAKAKWRRTRDYRMWRAAVVRRDRRCQCCGSLKRRHAHHIKHATYHPALRFDPANGVTLCSGCHSILHNKLAGGYRRKCESKHLDRLMVVRDYFTAKELKVVMQSKMRAPASTY